MRSFKKMLIALSAATVAFGAMALTAGAYEINANTDQGAISVSGSTFAEGGKFVLTYSGVEASKVELYTHCIEGEWNNTWYKIEPSYSAEGTIEYSYANVVNAISAYNLNQNKSCTIADLSHVAIKNNDASAQLTATIEWQQPGTALANEGTTADIAINGESIAEGSKFVVSYVGSGIIPFKVKCGTDWNWTEGIDPSKTTTVNNITTVEYSYENVKKAVEDIENKNFTINDVHHMVMQNYSGSTIYIVSGPEYVAPLSVVITPVGEKKSGDDGYYAQAYTFNVEPDYSGRIRVTVGGESQTSTTTITGGTTKFGLIIGSKDEGKVETKPTVALVY